MKRRGFTLLEMLVATAILGIAVVALLSNLSTSMRNASRLAAHDRAALLARQKLEELLIESKLPLEGNLEGPFDPALTGGVECGWRAHVQQFEAPPNVYAGLPVLQRVAVEVWWNDGGRRRSLTLGGYRRFYLPPEGVR